MMMKSKIVGAFCICVLFLFQSCHTTKEIQYVDREVVKERIVKQYDSIFVHDSVFREVLQRGDTIFDTKYVYKLKYKDKLRVDTFYRDSIRIEYQEKVKEEKYIPKWCYYSLIVNLILIIFAIIKLLKCLRII